MLKYSLGEKIEAFTTDRTVGRNIPGVIYPHQVHTDRIFAITSDFLALSERDRKDALEGIDAIMSDVKDVVMGVSTADCIPVIVYDSAHHVAAAIHAGWKGTRLRIVTKAIKEMQRLYGTDPSVCTAAIGQEVVDAFVEAGFDMSRYVIMKAKPHIDLKAINLDLLTAAGVRQENVFVSEIDTFTDENYFSARREQHGVVKCGRILSGFCLK